MKEINSTRLSGRRVARRKSARLFRAHGRTLRNGRPAAEGAFSASSGAILNVVREPPSSNARRIASGLLEPIYSQDGAPPFRHKSVGACLPRMSRENSRRRLRTERDSFFVIAMNEKEGKLMRKGNFASGVAREHMRDATKSALQIRCPDTSAHFPDKRRSRRRHRLPRCDCRFARGVFQRPTDRALSSAP